ncbi:Pol Polyprotein [Phytophthora megakarya]|uniref:Pol Polyprotein n=1 Tax=Phytophthora megakarya TaxID=4795 RepID=A0A225WNT5_9STRA|nr:Pol Polyprotein [Phytophthora megakarya]
MRLSRWGLRARTYRGRLLILQAMILSLLWHFTQHFDLPDDMVRRIQSLCEQYLLTRQNTPSRHFAKLAKPSLCHIPFNRGGFQIPRIAVSLKAQRIRFLQQLMLLAIDDPWRAVANELRGQDLPGSSGSSLFDILSCPYYCRSAVVEVTLLSAWWRFTWLVWSSIPWLSRDDGVDIVHFQTSLLQAYGWSSTHPELLISQSDGRLTPLFGKPGATRTFRTRFASASGFRSLMDFVEGRSWPTVTDFISRFLMVIPDWSLRHRVGYLRDLYEDLSSVFTRVVDPNGSVHGPCPALPGLPFIGVKRPRSFVLLPTLTKFEVLDLLGLPNFPLRDHPISHHVKNTTMDTIADTVLALKTLRQVVLPIYADFHFRLGWKLLPTRSRFSFLRGLDMSGINCAYTSCEAVETDRHLLFECPPAKTLWGLCRRRLECFHDRTIDVANDLPPPASSMGATSSRRHGNY